MNKFSQKIRKRIIDLPKNIHNTKFISVEVVTLIVTIFFGIWGILLTYSQNELSDKQMKLSLKQDSTSLDLLHFSQLLRKTDTVIQLATNQLLLNQEEQKIANKNYSNSELGNTYLRMDHGFMYLVAIIDGYSRYVVAWSISNTLTVGFCVETLKRAISIHGKPEYFNTDQGTQFTSKFFTGVLLDKISI